MYHSHVDVAVQDAGLLGGFIVEDPTLQNLPMYRNYLCLLEEWAIGELPWEGFDKRYVSLKFCQTSSFRQHSNESPSHASPRSSV